MNLKNEIEENSVEGVMFHKRLIKNASRGKIANKYEKLPATDPANSDAELANR